MMMMFNISTLGSMLPGIPGYEETQELIKECASPPLLTCPALSLRSTGPMPEDIEIQTMLSEAINRIMDFFFKRENDDRKASLIQ